ncbi:MAG: WD40/YVTN/BNR-like repeat-containing protein, partial [Emticicia sp.]
IWAGTDDGLIHVTKDAGKTWQDVTPLTPKGEQNDFWIWSKISQIDAGHFDKNVAYVAVNRIRLDDQRPHIFRTKDGGKTWQEIVKGLPNEPINTVREDPTRKGLLFAGSENAVYVSFDDGENWQSLRLNMPATSIRDLVIKDDDIVVGTHGRSFWILDDITPLRQISDEVAKSNVFLYKPQNTYRVRWSTYTDTPIPQEEPQGQNPPDGAVINYYLKEKVNGVVKLEIYDANRKLIRTFTSNDKPYELPDLNIPHYWIRPQQILSAEAGSHRFMWDLHYAPLNLPPSYPISAVYQNTAPDATSPWVMPGYYTVLLTVDGRVQEQNFLVKMDPRVKTSAIDLKTQHDLSLAAYEGRIKIQAELAKMKDLRQRIRMTEEGLKQFDAKEAELKKIQAGLASVHNILQDADSKPTTQVLASAKELLNKLNVILK